jgi:hypothetical protein
MNYELFCLVLSKHREMEIENVIMRSADSTIPWSISAKICLLLWHIYRYCLAGISVIYISPVTF